MTTEATYRAKPRSGGLTDADAALLGAHFQRMITERGPIRPEDIVAEAENPDSPLHAFFEWDNDQAAHRYRLSQASWYLRHIEIVRADAPSSVRAFHVVRLSKTGPSGYVSLEMALSDDSLMMQVIVAERRRLQQAAVNLGKYEQLRGTLEHVQSAIEALLDLEEVYESAPSGKVLIADLG